MIYMEIYEHLSGGPCGEGTRGVQSAERAGGEEVTVSDSDAVSVISLSLMAVFSLCSGKHVYSCLNLHLQHMSGDAAHLEQLTAGLHIWPDFHGNRSPLADQTSRGSVTNAVLITDLTEHVTPNHKIRT